MKIQKVLQWFCAAGLIMTASFCSTQSSVKNAAITAPTSPLKLGIEPVRMVEGSVNYRFSSLSFMLIPLSSPFSTIEDPGPDDYELIQVSDGDYSSSYVLMIHDKSRNIAMGRALQAAPGATILLYPVFSTYCDWDKMWPFFPVLFFRAKCTVKVKGIAAKQAVMKAGIK